MYFFEFGLGHIQKFWIEFFWIWTGSRIPMKNINQSRFKFFNWLFLKSELVQIKKINRHILNLECSRFLIQNFELNFFESGMVQEYPWRISTSPDSNILMYFFVIWTNPKFWIEYFWIWTGSYRRYLNQSRFRNRYCKIWIWTDPDLENFNWK